MQAKTDDRRGRDWSAVVLAVLVFACLAGGSPFAFEVSSTQWPLLALVGFAAWVFLLVSPVRLRRAELDLPAACLAVFASVSLLWAPDPVAGLTFIVKFVGCWLLVVALRAHAHEFGWLLLAGAIAAAAVFGIAAPFVAPDLSGYVGGFGNPNFQAEFLLMALPWMVAGMLRAGHAALRGTFLLALVAAAIHLIVGSDSKIVILVLVVVPGASLGILAVQRRPMLLLGIVPVVVAIGAISYLRGIDEFVRSLNYRGEIGFNAVAMWLDHPLFGAGTGAFNALYPLYQERHLEILPASYLIRRNYLVGAAHNEFLQFLVQFGLVGLAILIAAAWSIVRARSRFAGNRIWAWCAAISLANGVVAALVGFPFQMPATLLLAAISLAAIGGPDAGRAAPGRLHLRRLAAATALVVIAVAGFFGVQGAIAQMDFRWALQTRDVGPDLAFRFHRRAADRAPWDSFVVSTLYLTFTSWQGRVDRATEAGSPPAFPFLRDPLADGADSNGRWYSRSLQRMPYGVNLRLARLQHLLNSRQHDVARAEIEEILRFLDDFAAMVPEARILELYHSLLLRDADRAQAALARLGANPFASGIEKNVDTFAAEIDRLRREPSSYRFVGIVHLSW